jgi:hypothetical protein
MIPHPDAWFDNPPTHEEPSMWKSWLKTLGGWVIRFGPGLVEAILEAKRKETPPAK